MLTPGDDLAQFGPEAARQHRIYPQDAETCFRAVFVSDIHLGLRNTRLADLMDFLNACQTDTLYLVGDIFDGWRLRKVKHWRPDYGAFLQLLLDKARNGTRVVYLPGNHDEFLRNYLGTPFGEIEITDQTIHVTAAQKRYLVTHGDQFDAIVRNAKWLAHVGGWTFNAAQRLDGLAALSRGRLKASVTAFTNRTRKYLTGFMSRLNGFEEAAARAARDLAVDGVICGHSHSAGMHAKYGVHYVNAGDWIESCTAVVETDNGQLELLRCVPSRTAFP